jgi:hypothetical protein
VINDWRAFLAEQKTQQRDAAQAEQEKLLIALDQKKREQERLKLEARKSQLKALFGSVRTTEALTDVAIIVKAVGEKERLAARSIELAMVGQTNTASFQSGVFTESFRASNHLRDLFSGDFRILEEARAIQLLPTIDNILLAELSSNCSNRIREVITCELALQYRYYNGNGGLLADDVIYAAGPGFSEQEAVSEGVLRLSGAFRERALELVRTKGG